jgi:hypothetical protein
MMGIAVNVFMKSIHSEPFGMQRRKERMCKLCVLRHKSLLPVLLLLAAVGRTSELAVSLGIVF